MTDEEALKQETIKRNSVNNNQVNSNQDSVINNQGISSQENTEIPKYVYYYNLFLVILYSVDIGLLTSVYDEDYALGEILNSSITLSVTIFAIYYAMFVYVLVTFKDLDKINKKNFIGEAKTHNYIIGITFVLDIIVVCLYTFLKGYFNELIESNTTCAGFIIFRMVADFIMFFTLFYSIYLLINLSNYLLSVYDIIDEYKSKATERNQREK